MKRTITYRKAQLSDSMALYELVCDLEGIMLLMKSFTISSMSSSRTGSITIFSSASMRAGSSGF